MDQIINGIDNLKIVKTFIWYTQLLFTALPVLYVLFAFIVLRQVSLMTKSFSGPLSIILKVIAFFHLLAAIIVATISVLSVL